MPLLLIPAIDIKDGKISLSMKQLSEDPWVSASKKYTKGDAVSAVVIKYNKHGALASIEEGEIVKSKVLEIRDNLVVLDIGFKSEGMIPRSEFLDREGNGPQAKYFNTPAAALFLDENSPRYIGGLLTMLNARLFKFWNDLPEALRTGRAQNETKHGQKGPFEELYANSARLEQFMDAMAGISRLNAEAVAGNRDRYVIASKFGNLRRPDGTPYADGRPEYVKAACERESAPPPRLPPRGTRFRAHPRQQRVPP